MENDKFLLVSLEEEKSKILAQVLSNDTSRKILNLLSERDYSPMEISEKLNSPLTTVHYNLQQLEKAGLIESKEFKWSEKGKKIRYYKLVNKSIIIAQKQKDFFSILKNVLPVTLIGIAVSGIIYFVQNLNLTSSIASFEGVQKSAIISETAIKITPNYALYFLIGFLFSVLLYIIISYWRRKK